MIQEKLTNAIIGIYDENGTEIKYNEAKIELAIAKYSQTKKPSNNLFIDGVPRRNKYYKISYKCERCGNVSVILLCKYLKKDNLCCCHCRETKEKREWHGEVLKMIHSGVKYEPRTKIKHQTYDFENESESFKNEYYKKFLTEDEFDKIKKYIYSVNNIVIEGKDVKFLPHEKAFNGMKYRQMILIDNQYISFQKIKLKCAYCGNIFSVTRKLKERLLKNNFDCFDCYLNNKTFKKVRIRENLSYQGKEELNFIRKCDENGIKIVNGPRVKYFFNNKERTYIIDFELPDLHKLIEIKDNHIWHKKQIESGKWEAKEKAAIEYANKINYKYHLLFPNDIEIFFKTPEEIV